MESNIEYIIEGCVKNDHTSQTALFNMFYPKMFSISSKYTSNIFQAQDIVQLSFVKIFNKISQYSFNNSLEGWIRRIVVNTALDEIRKDKFRNNIVDIEVASLKAKDKKYSEDNLNIILNTINELPPKCREAFKLHVIENYPHQKVAQMMGISEGTSKSNVFKAKAKLRDLLRNKLIEEDFI